MNSEKENRKELYPILQKAEVDLREMDDSPFSETGFKALKQKIDINISELIAESIQVAKRHQADTVSPKHVERANEYLWSNTQRSIYRHLGTIGGIFLGAALSNYLAMTTSPNPEFTLTGVLISGVLGIIGSFLVAINIAND